MATIQLATMTSPYGGTQPVIAKPTRKGTYSITGAGYRFQVRSLDGIGRRFAKDVRLVSIDHNA